jgi:hypothetical protein
MEIDGPAAALTVSGGGECEVFHVYSELGSPVAATLKNLTISHGSASGTGGGLLVDSLTNVTVLNCAIASNSAVQGGGGISVQGGHVTLTNCTLYANQATGNEVSEQGGALYIQTGGAILYNCTVAENTTQNGCGGIVNVGGTLELGNSIVATNPGAAVGTDNLSGTVMSDGYNLLGLSNNATITGVTTGNQMLTDEFNQAGLDRNGLTDNGGPTPTIALTTTSPALDQGLTMGSVSTDQRGRTRPFDYPGVAAADGGDGSDIGAYELGLPAPRITVECTTPRVSGALGALMLSNNATIALGIVDNADPTLELDFTIRNTGTADLDLTGSPAVAIGGTNASDFTVVQPATTTLVPADPDLQATGGAPGSTTTFSVTLSTSTLGTKTATFSIASDDSDRTPFSITITGSVVHIVNQPPDFLTPAANSVNKSPLNLSFSLPVAAKAGTVKLTFYQNDSGMAIANGDPGLGSVTLGTALETAGMHSTTVNAAAAGFGNGTFTLGLSYQDVAGDSVQETLHQNVTIDSIVPTITGTFSPLLVSVGDPVPDFAAEASVSENLPVLQSPAAGTTFATAGLQPVTLTATDAAGNTGTRVVTVDVRPLTATPGVTVAPGGHPPGAGEPGGPAANARLFAFTEPAVDDDGEIAYGARWISGTTINGGLFTSTECIAKGGARISGLAAGTYASFGPPILRNGGIGFSTMAAGVAAAKATLYMAGPPERPVPLVQTGTIAASSTGQPLTGHPTYRRLSGFAVNGTAAAFQATIGGTGVTAKNNVGLWMKDATHGPTLVLRTGQTLGSRMIKKLVSYMAGNGSPGQDRGWLTVGSQAQVLALVMFDDGGEAVVSTGFTGAPVILSATGETGPGLPGIAGSSFLSYSVPATNDAGQLAFLATIETTGGGLPLQGIFANLEGTGFAPVALVGGTALGASFSQLKDPVLAEDGGLAFAATVAGGSVTGVAGNTLWWQPPGGSLQLLAEGGQRAGVDLPMDVQWKAFTNLAIAASRGPIFQATLVRGQGGVTAANDTGLWATDRHGEVRLVFRTGLSGAIRPGKTLKTFQVLAATGGTQGVSRSFNGEGRIVWLARFTDGTEDIITSEVP